MSEVITEALLEMHYHRALVDLFANHYGAMFLQLVKPSAVREAWVGFDQGWVRTTLTQSDLLNQLRGVLASQGSIVPKFYVGYFMQFKPVVRISKRGSNCPGTYTAPYYRVALSLKPNRTTGLSQHETLLRLTKVTNSDVTYACPMLFDHDRLYEPPDLDALRIVEVATAPAGWATNQSHFITFQTPDDPNPQWMSEPEPAKVYAVPEWLHSSTRSLPKLTGDQVADLIEAVQRELPSADRKAFREERDTMSHRIPACFSVVEFGSAEDAA